MIEQCDIKIGDYIYFNGNYRYEYTPYYKHVKYKIIEYDATKKREKLLIHNPSANKDEWFSLEYFDLVKYKRTNYIRKLLQ
jgi:hypothetical protein